MSTLKFLKTRINSIKSTQKITSAMKLVASSNFKKAELTLTKSYDYTVGISSVFQQVLDHIQYDLAHIPFFLKTPSSSHILIIISGNRGLCGGFNSDISRKANKCIKDLLDQGKNLEIYCFGSKASAGVKAIYHSLIKEDFSYKSYNTFENFSFIAQRLKTKIETSPFQSCSVLYTSFRSLMVSNIYHHPLIPFEKDITLNNKKFQNSGGVSLSNPIFEIEPASEKFLNTLAFENFKAQLYFALCESTASEHSTRMVAMDNATKNAKDILEQLEILYHRTRQATITKELIEIIAGAQAL